MILRRFAAPLLAALALAIAGPAGPAAAQPACGSTVSGSITLTADLSCSGSDGLVVVGPARVNLAGFTISGDATPGTAGLRVASGDVVIVGGTVSGFQDGILIAAGRAVVQNVTASLNSNDGVVQAGGQVVVRASRAANNGADGFDLPGPATIGNSTATDNGAVGIKAGPQTVDQGGNAASGNGTDCVNVVCA